MLKEYRETSVKRNRIIFKGHIRHSRRLKMTLTVFAVILVLSIFPAVSSLAPAHAAMPLAGTFPGTAGNTILDIRKDDLTESTEKFWFTVIDSSGSVDLTVRSITVQNDATAGTWTPYGTFYTDSAITDELADGRIMLSHKLTARIEGLPAGSYIVEEDSGSGFDADSIVCEDWDSTNDVNGIFCPGDEASHGIAHIPGLSYTSSDFTLTADKITRVCFHNWLHELFCELEFTKIVEGLGAPDEDFVFVCSYVSGPLTENLEAMVDWAVTTGPGSYTVNILFAGLVSKSDYRFEIFEVSDGDGNPLESYWNNGVTQMMAVSFSTTYAGIDPATVVWSDSRGYITNTYTPPAVTPDPVDVPLSGTKQIADSADRTGLTFSFTVTKNGAATGVTGSNASGSAITFSPGYLTFSEEGTYTIVVSENTVTNWTNDGPKTFYIKVEDDLAGQLTAELFSDPGCTAPISSISTFLTFTNTYTDPTPPVVKYKYKVEFYKDSLDESDLFDETAYIGEYDEDDGITEALVGADLGDTDWLNSYKPHGYHYDSAAYIIISVDESENIVKVLYVQDAQTTTTYPYRVKYYKDSVDESNLIGTEDGLTEFPEDYILTAGDVQDDLGSDWRNLHRPGDYGRGAVQRGPQGDYYPVITVDPENNVVIVLYIYVEPPAGPPPDDTTTPPKDPDPPPPPPSPQPPPPPPDPDPDPDPDPIDTDPGDKIPPREPHIPGGNDRYVPPKPTIQGRTVTESDDGIFVEFDEDTGVPLGEWRWDDDGMEWIYDEYPPLSELPQTGAANMASLYLTVLGFTFIFAGAALNHKAGKRGSGAK